MIARRMVRALWIAVASLAATAAWRSYVTQERLHAPGGAPGLATLVDIPEGPTTDSLDDASVLATDANPFRWDRSAADPSAQAAGPLGGTIPGAVSAPAVQISLRGILGGPPWTAVLTGVPGAPGAVVLRVGDTIAGFSIVRIRRDTVVVRGAGSVYTLTLMSK